MKNLLLNLLLISTLFSYSQTENEDFNRMIEAEMKSASSTINFRANTNTQDYDVTYHELRFTVDPAVYFINGEVTTTFTALTDMNTVTFDMANELTASSVTINSIPVSYSRSVNNEIIITLPATLTTNSSQTVKIIYSGAPPQSGFSAFAANEYHNGVPVMWTLSEPYGARDWWPCKQDLSDKIASIDVYITSPSAYVSVSNGIEQSIVDNGDGTKTTHFHHGYPIPAYLIAIASTNYQIYNQQAGLGTVASPFFPIVNYIYPETATSTQASLAVTPTIMNLFESLIGDYPFRNEKYGHAQFGWGGGMEHTTVSFMGGWSRSLIAHELAHQWFGDQITCGTWKDIWLNEGITEYMAGIVVENLDGATSFVSWKNSKINSITSQTGGNLYLTDAQIQNINTIFSSRITYNKGSMVTNMIRYKMGDTNFFQALKNYLADPALAYQYAVTPQFQNHLEMASGLDFTEFFNDWVYNEGYPTYTITGQNWGAGQARILVNQTQSHASVSYFEMPITVRLSGSGGQTQDFILDNTTNNQEFIVNVPFQVTNVEFDPNKDIISRNNTATLSNEQFELENSVVLYPNPSDNELHIKLPNSIELKEVEFYNAIGQLTLTKNTTDFSVSQLNNGVHFVKITTNQGVIHKNFIKK
ncbi:M1 family aminopeptidase [Flavobacterium sp. N2270]|uniref:M1 family aminopeptidase n=1 Tax=Flavobacterium sp. N2270 TaxID=2986831 RepID=UPI002225B2DA|nr:M1 family aminopeptidase [Flavobacterium sp. N2270]